MTGDQKAGFVLIIGFFIALALAGVMYYVTAQLGCDDQGGVLVRDALGFYECVAPLKE